jgi:hypothetical protein
VLAARTGALPAAPKSNIAQLERMVANCLTRGLFAVAEARARIAELDMRTRPGAQLLGRVLPP